MDFFVSLNAMTVFSRLSGTISFAYAVQIAAAAIFVPQHSDKFYDLMGSVGFLSAGFVSLYYPWISARISGQNIPFPSLQSHAPRQLILTGCLTLWAGRLGYFLFQRVLREGKDSRFDKIKHQPRKFTYFWLAQGTWISLVGLPVYLVNALPASAHAPLGPRDFIGLGIFAGSFLFEVVADYQKNSWRAAKKEKKHSEQFITSGLWSISRHPNYVGEVGIHTGLSAMATTAIASPFFPHGTIVATLISPIVTYLLLKKVSGVPPLEKAGDKKFGSDPKWIEYKRAVPVFFPWVKP